MSKIVRFYYLLRVIGEARSFVYENFLAEMIDLLKDNIEGRPEKSVFFTRILAF